MKPGARRWLTAVLLPSLVLSAVARAQLSAVQALKVRRVQDPQVSPDGRRIAFIVGEPPKGSSDIRSIWLFDLKDGSLAQLTKGGRETLPRWSPDGKWLGFVANRQVVLWPTAGGDPVPLTHHAGGLRSFVWSPAGKQIAFLASEPEPDGDSNDAQLITVVGGRDTPSRLWMYDVETKKERCLTSAPFDVSGVVWRADSSGMIVVASDHPDAEKWTDRIYSVALSNSEISEIAAPRGPFNQVSLSPDGSTIAYVGTRAIGPIPHDLFVVPAKGGAARNLTATPIDRPVSQYVWRDSTTIEALVQSGFSNKLYSVKTRGKSTEEPFDVAPSNFAPMPNGGYVFVHESGAELPELWMTDKQGGTRQLTKLNESWKSIPIVKPETIRYKSFDGVEIEAALLRPAAPAGTKLPAIFLFHGGPVGRWYDRFDAEGQMLVSRGYAVLYPNVRAATGYGHRMIDLIRSEPLGGTGWAQGPFQDALAGVDELIRRGIADPDRLGIGGWSYGGYMAAWAVTHTNRFKVAVAGAGVYDLFNDLGTETPSYIPGDQWNFGPFFEDRTREMFQRDSPITYVGNVHTPILMLHGEIDRVDTIGQAYSFYRALKSYGATTQFVVYPREGHSLRDEKHQLDRLTRTVEWYDRYLKRAR